MTAHPTKAATAAIANNRKALREYTILERREAGIELLGSEVKSVRAGKVDLSTGYARERKDGLYLYDVNIATYEQANQFNHEPKRPRRLLLHKREMRSLISDADQKGLTIIPLKMYFKRGWAKVELGLCKGKRIGDKRQALRKKTADREMARAVAAARRK